jgi:hypothetical protein
MSTFFLFYSNKTTKSDNAQRFHIDIQPFDDIQISDNVVTLIDVLSSDIYDPTMEYNIYDKVSK